MQQQFGDDEHYDDDEVVTCDECGSQHLEFVDAYGTDFLTCQDCGAVKLD